jgi:hypothetical protein
MIPESIALQGVEVVNEYKNKKSELDKLSKEIYEVISKIEQIENEMRDSIDEYRWNRPNSYLKDWKNRKIPKRHFALLALTEKHGQLSFRYSDLDNQYASLTLELYNKGWLSEWMQNEYTKLGFS